MLENNNQSADSTILNRMLEAGVHFGHQKAKWNPKMKPYVYTIRHNVHIIDLEKSIVKFEEALDLLKKDIDDGKKILFIGTRVQDKKISLSLTCSSVRRSIPFKSLSITDVK